MAASLLEQAKDGDGGAIAALLTRALQPQGITVRGDRHTYCLQLWLTGSPLPPQGPTVAYIRQYIQRLGVTSIGIVQIQAEPTEASAVGWQTEISLLDMGEATSALAPQAPQPAPFPPSPSPRSTASAPDYPSEGAAPTSRNHQSPLAEELPATISRAYTELQLPLGAPLAQVESRYFKLKAAALRRSDRAAIEPLKWAFETLKSYLEQSHTQATAPVESLIEPPRPAPATPTTAAPNSLPHHLAPVDPATQALEQLTSRLRQLGLPAQITIQANELHVCWPAVRVTNPKQATAQVYQLIQAQNLADQGLATIDTLVVTGLSRTGQTAWQQTLSLPRRPTAMEDTDLMSFHNRYSNALIFPALMGLGMAMNAVPMIDRLLWGIKIWIHEFGHATVAWMAGRQAIPLPIGWTNINPQRSLLVYLGILVLLGLLFWAGRREQKRWPMGLAVVLAILQFWMTWVMSVNRFDMLLYFGGIGGELYLSTLLMVGYYFPMPNYWRWDFYRFPVVLGAAFTFWGQFGLWKQIRRGRASIPFGGLWGDADHGDMNILANRHGWTPGDMINTYNGIANVCLLALIGVYGYVLYRRHRHDLILLSQHWPGR
ncbi:hypothetical protein [Nodosilinea sp. P-1105]|uniref:hypothetical protein n=1 Tax=Nodosilinea sp. P-1105 TaxID=2546229 RepID=UPI00146D17F4|nr:hypothetical protein [Nodosilinea sp. P-1105]NMF82269.1 hypothetical protein [Nodosilinea sp. P-1105]